MSNQHSSYIYFRKLTPNAYAPKKNHVHGSTYLLRSMDNVTVSAKSSTLIATGVSLDLPRDLYARIEPCNEWNTKGLMISSGLVDSSNSKNEIKILAFNTTNKDIVISGGDGVAQFVVDMVLKVFLHELVEP